MDPVKKAVIRLSTGFGSYLQTIRMVVFPFVLAIPAGLLWNFLYKRGWHSPSLAVDEPIINAILPGLLLVHAIIVGFMFSHAANNIDKLLNAIHEKDGEGFLRIAENRMPTPMKYILFVSANFTMGWTMSLHYESYGTGLAAVLSVGYMLSLMWEVISDFDDPIRGMWVVKNIPTEWIPETTNIKKRFTDHMFELIERLFGTRK